MLQAAESVKKLQAVENIRDVHFYFILYIGKNLAKTKATSTNVFRGQG